MYLSGMFGLGDNLYQRAVVREMGPLHLMTPWPQLYADLPQIKCVRPRTHLRTQAKNIQRPGFTWHPAPNEIQRRIGYTHNTNMLESFMQSAGVKVDRVTFDGPPVAKTHNHPYIVVRPATIRHEWLAGARNPDPAYLCQAIELLREHFDIISIADIDGFSEQAVEPLPYANETYHKGELTTEELFELVANASGVVGGVGWLLPASIAYKVPMMLLYGGWGHVNGPNSLFDRRMDISRITQVFPDRFCMCNERAHNCDKRISNFGDKVQAFANTLEHEHAAFS